MTADVIDLASRRPPTTRPGEPACGCPHHMLTALVGRVQQQLDANNAAGQLLTDWPTQADVLTDVVSTVKAALVHADDGETKP